MPRFNWIKTYEKVSCFPCPLRNLCLQTFLFLQEGEEFLKRQKLAESDEKEAVKEVEA